MNYDTPTQLCKICKANQVVRGSRFCATCKREHKRRYDKGYFEANVEQKTARAVETKRGLLAWYRALKHGKQCAALLQGCSGGPYHECQLDYDHLPDRGRKLMDVSKMVRLGYSKEKILAEMAKCWLVCSNCHRLLTKMRHKGMKTPGSY